MEPLWSLNVMKNIKNWCDVNGIKDEVLSEENTNKFNEFVESLDKNDKELLRQKNFLTSGFKLTEYGRQTFQRIREYV